ALVWHPQPRPGRVRSLSWEYADGHRVPPHAHAWHQLLYAVRGVMELSAAGGSWIVPVHRGPGVPAGMEHAIRMAGAGAVRPLHVDGGVGRDLRHACRTVDVPPLLRELVLDVVGRGSLDRRVPAERHLLDVLLDQIRGIRPGGVHLPEPRDARARRVADL